MMGAEILPLSREELTGLVEMRRLLAALRRRGDEHCDILWVWRGPELQRLAVKFEVLIKTS